MRRTWISIAAAALVAAMAAGCEEPKAPDQWTPIQVTATATPLEPDRPGAIEAGDLVYRGGLVLKSSSALFGGFSGLSVAADGTRFVAVSDTGVWLSGELALDADGRLTGLSNPRIAQMRDERGEPLQGKRQSDAEDLARLPDGRYAVSFEQEHRILIYDLDGKGPFAPAVRGPTVAGTEGMHPNEGLESLAALPDGALVGVAEHAPRGAGSPIWIWPKGATTGEPIGRANRPQGYGMSGLATLPNGDLISIERLYLPLIGVRVNVRHLPLAKLRATPPEADGRVIGALEPPMSLDNFEGVAAVPRADGAIRIYLIADDNYSSNQRTLLYAFDWTPPAGLASGAVAAAPVEPPAAVEAPAATPTPAPAPAKVEQPKPEPVKPAVAPLAPAAPIVEKPAPKPKPKPKPKPVVAEPPPPQTPPPAPEPAPAKPRGSAGPPA
jgi:hypothetical protein